MARRSEHKNNLVRTAMALFRTQGFAATGLLQIVNESGAPKGSLYHYFPTGKDGLAEAAVELAGEMVAEMLNRNLQQTSGALDFIEAVAQTYATWMEEGEFASGCPIATTMLECAPHTASIAAAGSRIFDTWIKIAEAAFERDPELKDRAPERAETLIAAIEGALILSRVRQDASPLRNLPAAFA